MANSDGANEVPRQRAHGHAPTKEKTRRPPAAARATPGGEIGGPKGPEPTRYGDWERNGRCLDF
jgi:hypothetical protein